MIGDEVQIPSNVLVRCPLAAFDLTRAYRCEGCQHFQGLVEYQPPGGQGAFHKRYGVRCAYPVDRELQALASPGD
jgi:hypothetical protein